MNANSYLLCVDDDPSILNALKRLLRREDYEIITAGSAEEGLEKLTQYDVQVILSDHHMPGMSGTDFLKQARAAKPHSLRILMTGEPDIDSVINAINEGAIYKYVCKPWNAALLTDTVNQAFTVYELEQKNRHLTEQLKQANTRLGQLNKSLEERVEEKAKQLLKLKFYDEDTGLANKLLLTDRLNDLISYAKRDGENIYVMTLGIDNLAKIKQGLDEDKYRTLLKQIAGLIAKQTRESDRLGRIAEDSLCLLFSDKQEIDGPSAVAKRLINATADPITVDNNIIRLSNSVGISVYPNDALDAGKLIQNAESAMSDAREKKRAGYQYYSDELNKRNETRLALEAELHNAIRNNEFALYYQPRVCSETFQIAAAEGLIRWQHPVRGLVSPAEFVPLLEETGLIEVVGEWVIQEACAVLKTWLDEDIEPIKLSVNLSPLQLQSKNLIGFVTEQLAHSSIHRYLEFEITESVLMHDVEKTQNRLAQLQDMGIKLAIDDFGTGYSSLSYLTKFPLDHLKIDRSFVQGLGTNRDSNALVRSIIALAQSLRMRTIAEGIETTEHVQALKILGCEELQGFLFSRPLPLSELEVLLRSHGGKILLEDNPADISDTSVRQAAMAAG